MGNLFNNGYREGLEWADANYQNADYNQVMLDTVQKGKTDGFESVDGEKFKNVGKLNVYLIIVQNKIIDCEDNPLL